MPPERSAPSSRASSRAEALGHTDAALAGFDLDSPPWARSDARSRPGSGPGHHALLAGDTGKSWLTRADVVLGTHTVTLAGAGPWSAEPSCRGQEQPSVRADRFADGQLFVNLRGFDPELPPLDPAAVLNSFLRALQVPARQIPSALDERSAMFRDLVHDRQVLILLDNAVDGDQVRDLIPAGPTCLVLITSRRSLAGLDGARPHHLDVFSTAEALELLGRIAGTERVTAEPQAAAELVELCGRLPLAVALTASHLRGHPPQRSLADQITRLRTHGIDAFGAGGRSLRPVFDNSYRSLESQARRLFRLLSLHPGADFPPGRPPRSPE